MKIVCKPRPASGRFLRPSWLLVAVVGWTLSWPSVAWAKLDMAKESTIPGGHYVVVAYLILWVMALAYLALLGRRQTKLGLDLEALGRRIDSLGWDEEVDSTSDVD